jgi:hypothetical protein
MRNKAMTFDGWWKDGGGTKGSCGYMDCKRAWDAALAEKNESFERGRGKRYKTLRKNDDIFRGDEYFHFHWYPCSETVGMGVEEALKALPMITKYRRPL